MIETIQGLITRLPLVSSKLSSRIYIDDVVSRLHYFLTAKLLYISSAFSLALLLFDWVDCFSHSEAIPPKMANVYCWMQNTFVLPLRLNGTIGEDLAHQGVDQALPGDERVYISYYQWLPLFLFFQGFSFEIPHFLWKAAEHMEMNNLARGFQYPLAKNGDESNKSDETIERDLQLIANYVKKSWSQKPWKFRPWIFFLCMLLSCGNAIAQIYFLTRFFQLDNLATGWDVYNHLTDNYFLRTDALVSVFPRMVKCIFHQFGAGGSVQTHDILCLLPFNVYTEKYFALCLAWFYVLAAITILSTLFWLLILLITPLRSATFSIRVFHMFPDNRVVINCLKDAHNNAGNWFLVWLLCKNIHVHHLEKLLENVDLKGTEWSNKTVGYQNNPSFDRSQKPLLKPVPPKKNITLNIEDNLEV